MYTKYFGFREPPFSVTPDPRFFYENPVNQQATAGVQWGITGRRGFIVLIGEVGTGKTTLLRRLVANLETQVCFAFVGYPALSLDDLLSGVCSEFGVAIHDGMGRLEKLEKLKAFLIGELNKGRTAALLIDEAQLLDDEVLENLRVLSNLETSTHKLLQIVLVGQPELETRLNLDRLYAVKQRIAVQCRLSRLRDDEVGPYVAYRLAAVGYRGRPLFSPEAVEEIAAYSKGVPRLINIICDNALLIAYAASQRKVAADVIGEVARDLGLARPDSESPVLGEDSMAGPEPEHAGWARSRVRVRPRLVALGLAGLFTGTLLGLVAAGAFGWRPGIFLLAGVRQGLESFRSGVTQRKESVQVPEPPASADADAADSPGSPAARAEMAGDRESAAPAADEGAGVPPAPSPEGLTGSAPVVARDGTLPSVAPLPSAPAWLPPSGPRPKTSVALPVAPPAPSAIPRSASTPDPASARGSSGEPVDTRIEPPLAPDSPGPGTQVRPGPSPSRTPRSREAGGVRGPAQSASPVVAKEEARTPPPSRPSTTSPSATPQPTRSDPLDSSEIVDWFFKEYRGNN